ncbi:MAG: hypothetical protein IRZ32_15580 [Solirubrobacteraceae bacterium]|nr:hypothetical protein [Solirubrobacteraceae bacterium]
MTTHHQHPDEQRDGSAQTLLMWMGVATVIVTLLIIIGVTTMGATVGMIVAYGGLLVAAGVVLVFIMRFIGPEDH